MVLLEWVVRSCYKQSLKLRPNRKSVSSSPHPPTASLIALSVSSRNQSTWLYGPTLGLERRTLLKQLPDRSQSTRAKDSASEVDTSGSVFSLPLRTAYSWLTTQYRHKTTKDSPDEPVKPDCEEEDGNGEDQGDTDEDSLGLQGIKASADTMKICKALYLKGTTSCVRKIHE